MDKEKLVKINEMLRVLATVSCELRSLTEPRYKDVLMSSPEANDRLMNAAIAVREIGDALSKEIGLVVPPDISMN